MTQVFKHADRHSARRKVLHGSIFQMEDAGVVSGVAGHQGIALHVRDGYNMELAPLSRVVRTSDVPMT